MEVDEGKQSSSRPSYCWDVPDKSRSKSPGLLLVTMLPANQSVPACFPQISIGIVSVRNVRIFTVQLCFHFQLVYFSEHWFQHKFCLFQVLLCKPWLDWLFVDTDITSGKLEELILEVS